MFILKGIYLRPSHPYFETFEARRQHDSDSLNL